MELLLAGINHKSGGPLEARDRLAALGPDEALRRLREGGWGEAVVVATCNRFEIYVVVEGGGRADTAGPQGLGRFLESLAAVPPGRHVYCRAGSEAVSHLLTVASGLDSLVLGENEILGQVKSAYERSLAAGATGKITNVLFQRALYVGKKVRCETGVSSGQLSVASVAVTLAERIFGHLRESSVLILGAGPMAESAARHFISAKAASLRIANRTYERGRELAESLKVDAVSWEKFPGLLGEVDVVLCSTGAPQAVVTREMAAAAVKSRKERSLFMIDIAMPRDVEESVGALDHIYLYTLEHLQGIVDENMARRHGELDAARALVREKVLEFARWLEAEAAGVQASMRHARRPWMPRRRAGFGEGQ
ncbi:MAG: glutamyl-tRNA reductase [Elusimicrobia bacterium]|nr:glutamyl-tRNA reductase [Elusimicrobiota bacterium]